MAASTLTHLPGTGSDAVNAIPNGSCNLSADQRGVSRPQGNACDSGAVEIDVACFVSLNDSGTTDYASEDAGAVQAAINAASPDDTLKIAGTCAGVIRAAGITQTAYISRNLTLQGAYTHTNWSTQQPGVYTTTLDAAGLGRVAFISDTTSVTLDSLFITGGNSGAGEDGGGIYNLGTLVITNSAIYSNRSDEDGDGGVGAWGPATISNTTISGNSAVGGSEHAAAGLGMYGGFDVYLYNVTITDNTLESTAYGSGGISDWNDSALTLHVYNSIIANNQGGVQADCYMPVGNIDFHNAPNIVTQNLAGCSALNAGAVSNVDPDLGPLADNGGGTQTHLPQSGSPAIDTGDNATCTSDDQRGVARPQGDNCDLGAVESQGFTLTLSGGDNQSAEINSAFAAPLVVTLTTSETNLSVIGQVTTFTGPGSGAGLTQTLYTATSNSSGVASVTVTANSEWGNYQVIATTPVVAGPVTFTLQNYALYTLMTTTGGNVTAGGVYTNGETVTITATPTPAAASPAGRATPPAPPTRSR